MFNLKIWNFFLILDLSNTEVENNRQDILYLGFRMIADFF